MLCVLPPLGLLWNLRIRNGLLEKRVFGSRGICDYYVKIPGKFMIEICAYESDKEIPETFELAYGGVSLLD